MSKLSTAPAPRPLTAQRSGPLTGTVIVPGDKSISHRSIMLGGIAEGETRIHGLLEGEDVLHTATALRLLGATAKRGDDGIWTIRGTGLGNLQTPASTLDMGNSGTAARLLIGLVATHPITCQFDGDASLRKRPMARVMDPLVRMGANFMSRDGGRLPLTLIGAKQPEAISYTLPVASAQVKSAILLAGLNTPGVTTVIEPHATRDHSENMLRLFGAEIKIEMTENGADAIHVTGKAKLKGQTIHVPADPSSAAFPMVAALIRPGSEILLKNVGMNPRRTGLFVTLREMGADISYSNERHEGGEPIADIKVRAGELKGVTVPPERAPSMIDEYPILGVAAACANGTTRMRGLGELRVKESDRLGMVAQGLAAAGVKVAIEGDDLIVHGTGQAPKGGCMIETAMDHRIAMSFLILGLATDEPISIDDGSFIDTSFPGFTGVMNKVNAKIS